MVAIKATTSRIIMVISRAWRGLEILRRRAKPIVAARMTLMVAILLFGRLEIEPRRRVTRMPLTMMMAAGREFWTILAMKRLFGLS